ncbi:glycosyltransferase family 4 protein [Formosa haliotis]|uniref:glycosyltransferase family 4 protein n=1 Tax=Formosa haliotis TaxID=1555194 RepID=UPI000AE71844|nr:glycosyltransferase family 4 protein [Formosa haliotis]
MTVGFVTPEYPHALVNHAAGIGTSTQILAQALVKKGLKVIVFVYGQKLSKELDDFGVSIHLIKNQSYPMLGWFLHRKYINSYINDIVEKESIDILEAPDWTGITAFMRFKVPLVIRLHGSDAYFCKLEGRQQRLKNKWFERLGLRSAKAYIAPSSFAGMQTQRLFNLDRNKISTIHNGLDLITFKNSSPLDFQHKTIVYVGTIIRKKGS